jgi:hypothetical protein
MFKHIVYIRHIAIVAVLACLGLATAAPVVQARTLDQPQVHNVVAQKHPPTAGLTGILAYLHKHPDFMGKSHAKAVGAVETALQLCGAGWNSLSLDQQAALFGIAVAANQALAGSVTAKVTLLVGLIKFLLTIQQAGGGAAPAAPTGLTVSPDSGNGTVMHLTWRDNADDEEAFEVDNTVEHRDVPASPGTGTFTYTWTGLKPGSRACFRVQASNYDTLSTWDPSVGYRCATTSNPSPLPGPCTPKIDSVGPFAATATQTVEITGSCFGTGNTSSGADTAYFRISDLTAGWNACWTGDPGTDSVACNVSSWTNNEITFSGYTGDYGDGSWVVNSGDLIEIQVWNPQSGKGPATYEVTASGGCPNSNGCVG